MHERFFFLEENSIKKGKDLRQVLPGHRPARDVTKPPGHIQAAAPPYPGREPFVSIPVPLILPAIRFPG